MNYQEPFDQDPRPSVKETLRSLLQCNISVHGLICSYIETDSEWLDAIDKRLSSKGFVFNRVGRIIRVTVSDFNDVVHVLRNFGPLHIKDFADNLDLQLPEHPRAQVLVTRTWGWKSSLPGGTSTFSYWAPGTSKLYSGLYSRERYEFESKDGFSLIGQPLVSLDIRENGAVTFTLGIYIRNLRFPKGSHLKSRKPIPVAFRPLLATTFFLSPGVSLTIHADGLICIDELAS